MYHPRENSRIILSTSHSSVGRQRAYNPEFSFSGWREGRSGAGTQCPSILVDLFRERDR